jgi:hypothetical protein
MDWVAPNCISRPRISAKKVSTGESTAISAGTRQASRTMPDASCQ